jgi:solute carrier family 25 phosphate transporter 23/24/25/41
MSYNDSNIVVPLVLKFSNSRRNTISDQQKRGYVQRKHTILEILIFNYIPCALSSTILAPLNRIKVILQVQNMIPGVDKLNARNVFSSAIKEEGISSLFRGNASYCAKILSGLAAKTIFFDRLKNRTNDLKENIKSLKYKVFGINFILDTLCAVTASTLGLIMTHPYDLAYARIAGQYKVNNKNTLHYKKIQDCFHFNDNSLGKDFFFVKYYHGFLPAALQSIVFSSITLLGYQFISRSNQGNSSISSITGPSIVAFIASTISYPFDTIKRQMQVNGARGFKLQYNDILQLLVELRSDVKTFYRGFSVHLLRSLPLAPIQYLIFHNLTMLLAAKQPKTPVDK